MKAETQRHVKLTEIFQGPLLQILLGRLAVHHVVERYTVLEQIVDTAHDTEDTEREDPNTDNSDDGGVATNEPTEKTEESSDNVDAENSASQLPGWDAAPERTVGTSDENEPILRQRDLEEEDLITDTEVLDNTTVNTLTGNGRLSGSLVCEHSGKGNPGTNSENASEKDGHSPKLGQVPLDRCLGEWSIVVSNGKCGDISENSDEYNKFQIQRLIENGNPQTKEDFQMEGQSDTVDDVGIHTMENLARSLESVDDG